MTNVSLVSLIVSIASLALSISIIPAFVVTMADAERRADREITSAKVHLARVSESVRSCGCDDDGDDVGGTILEMAPVPVTE